MVIQFSEVPLAHGGPNLSLGAATQSFISTKPSSFQRNQKLEKAARELDMRHKSWSE